MAEPVQGRVGLGVGRSAFSYDSLHDFVESPACYSTVTSVSPSAINLPFFLI